MKKAVVNQELLHLLIKVYNQAIQYYYRFPDVIICGNRRLEKEEFDLLLSEGYIVSYYTDSFGKLYRLSKKGERFLHENLGKRKSKAIVRTTSSLQVSFPFD